MFKFNKSSGQASKLLLILAIVVFIAGIMIYLVMKMATPALKPVSSATPKPTATPGPVYQKQLNDINFVFESAVNRGSLLSGSDIINSNQFGAPQSVSADPGGSFLQVTIGAQNEGQANTAEGEWDIGNIVDSQGRNFIPMDNNVVGAWLSSQNACNVLLRPAFEPVLCTKIYQVSDKSTGLKITIQNKQKGKKATTSLLDLVVK